MAANKSWLESTVPDKQQKIYFTTPANAQQWPKNSGLVFQGPLLLHTRMSLLIWLSDQMSLLVNYLCCCYFSRQASSSLPPFLQVSYQHVSPPSLSPLSLHLNTVQTPDVC